MLCRLAQRLRIRLLSPFLILPLAACHPDELTDATTGELTTPAEVATPSFSSNFKGGIPFGTFAMPVSAFGDRFNGGMRNIWPQFLLRELAAIKARGGKVALMFAGNEENYKANGHFDLGKWKARIDRYRGINFTSYINDGTVIAHYLIDEPNDPANWKGKSVPPSTVEQMAEYSKRLWPGMPTVVRAEPGYLAANHRYLDAAWAQYLLRKGTAADYLRRNVAEAEKRGLGLIVGMNVLRGGHNKSPVTAKQLKEWGSVLLSSSYACAFISWTYDSKYISRSDVAGAMSYLAGKARSKATRSCRGSGKGGADGGAGLDVGSSSGSGGGSARGGSVSRGGSGSVSLKAVGRKLSGRHLTTLTWSGARGTAVYLYRNGFRLALTKNDGRHQDSRKAKGKGIYRYKVCSEKASGCSKEVRVVIK